MEVLNNEKVIFKGSFSFWDRNLPQAKVLLFFLLVTLLFILGFELLMIYIIGWSLSDMFPDFLLYMSLFILSFFGFVTLITSMLSLGEMNKLRNEVTFTEPDLIIDYQRSAQSPKLRNRIPMKQIKKASKHGWKYFRQRKKVTAWYDSLFIAPIPSFGALYHRYTHPKNLLVIYLKKPLFTTNIDPTNKLKASGGYESAFVLEVIVNIGKDDQDRFIQEIEMRS